MVTINNLISYKTGNFTEQGKAITSVPPLNCYLLHQLPEEQKRKVNFGEFWTQGVKTYQVP